MLSSGYLPIFLLYVSVNAFILLDNNFAACFIAAFNCSSDFVFVNILDHSSISCSVGLAVHHLNTFASSDHTASAAVSKSVIAGSHIWSFAQFINWFLTCNLSLPNHSVADNSVDKCHTVVLIDVMFCDVFPQAQSAKNFFLAEYLF